MNEVIMEILNEPIKSELDKKSYRIIRLTNQLQVPLISDQVDPSNGQEQHFVWQCKPII